MPTWEGMAFLGVFLCRGGSGSEKCDCFGAKNCESICIFCLMAWDGFALHCIASAFVCVVSTGIRDT